MIRHTCDDQFIWWYVFHHLTIRIHIHWLKIKQNVWWKPQVIDKSMPVFSKQFFSDIIPENIEIHSPLSVAIQAESPLGRKLIYTIVKGNELEEFAVDFNTGMSLINFLFDIVFFSRKRNPSYYFSYWNRILLCFMKFTILSETNMSLRVHSLQYFVSFFPLLLFIVEIQDVFDLGVINKWYL